MESQAPKDPDVQVVYFKTARNPWSALGGSPSKGLLVPTLAVCFPMELICPELGELTWLGCGCFGMKSPEVE